MYEYVHLSFYYYDWLMDWKNFLLVDMCGKPANNSCLSGILNHIFEQLAIQVVYRHRVWGSEAMFSLHI